MNAAHDLNISGRRSISFIGEELALVNNRETSEETRRRWTDVRVYKLDPDWAEEQYQNNRKRYGDRAKRLEPYRVGIGRCTTWDGERDDYRVFYLNTMEQVLNMVRNQAPQLYPKVEAMLEYEPSRRQME